MLWPVVQHRWVEVGAVRPHERADFGIDANLIVQREVSEWPEKLATKHGLEVDDLLGAIVECDPQRVCRLDLNRANTVNGMTHNVPAYLNGSIGSGDWPDCKRCHAAASSAWCNSAHAST